MRYYLDLLRLLLITVSNYFLNDNHSQNILRASPVIVSRPLVPRLDYIITDPAPMSTAFSNNISYNILAPPGGAAWSGGESGLQFKK